jgi:peptide/nickel transport system permease protein
VTALDGVLEETTKPWSRAVGPRFRVRNLATLAATVPIVLAFVVAGALAPVLAPYDPESQSLVRRLEPPAWEAAGSGHHPLGTDHLGRDVLSRLIHGARVSLIVVVTAIPASVAIGCVLGILAGYWRGGVDRLVMRLVDFQLAMPALLFALLLAAVFGPSLWNVVVVLVVFGWAGFARVVRAEVLSLRERDFVAAARALGAGDLRIMTYHLLPNVRNAVLVLATLDVSVVILAEASLSFLGVGVPPTHASWGGMVSEGRNYLTIAWWLTTVPGLAILAVALAGNFLGDWLRDATDPHLRNLR